MTTLLDRSLKVTLLIELFLKKITFKALNYARVNCKSTLRRYRANGNTYSDSLTYSLFNLLFSSSNVSEESFRCRTFKERKKFSF